MDVVLYSALTKQIEKNVSGLTLETNKAATIDVSSYSSAVTINPSTNNDAMKKATVTLTNIPEPSDIESNKSATIDVSEYTEPVEITPTQGKDGMAKATVTLSNIPVAGATLYAWKLDDVTVYTLTSTPTTSDVVLVCSGGITEGEIAEVGTDTITVGEDEYERYSTGDYVIE